MHHFSLLIFVSLQKLIIPATVISSQKYYVIARGGIRSAFHFNRTWIDRMHLNSRETNIQIAISTAGYQMLILFPFFMVISLIGYLSYSANPCIRWTAGNSCICLEDNNLGPSKAPDTVAVLMVTSKGMEKTQIHN